ncbi:simple sugar transport system permease protein [Micrococcales bacterium KH10]|nr:simple sugar transport system permease protein [Micrococcales bacterium KH10]
MSAMAALPGPGRLSPRTKDLLYRYAAVLVILAIIVFFSFANDNFLTFKNFTDILRSVSISAFLALGVTFSLVVDGFDVSIGSVASIATIGAAASMIVFRQELAVAIIVPLLLGVTVGLVNAFLIVKLGLPDLLATLAMLFVVNGIQLTYTNGYSIYQGSSFNGEATTGVMLPSFLKIGQGSILGIPVAAILLLVVVAIAHVFLTRTTVGRNMYMVGGNAEAARHFGLPVGRLRTLAYAISGLLAAVGGIVLTSRIGAGQVSAGAPMLMDAVAAAYVGYAIFGQKRPSVVGTLLGALLIGILLNGLTMMNVPYYAQDIVKGGVFIIALAFAFLRKSD